MKIAYIYYDLLNLYGESGNIKMIDKVLTDNKIKHEILYLSLEDKLKFKDYDLVYIGSGTETNQLIALENLKKYKKDIKKYIEEDKFFLSTGNSVDYFGKYIERDQKYDGLNIFDYKVSNDTRKMQDVCIKSNLKIKDIYGFINNSSYIKDNKKYLFDKEGVHYKNFYGTYILGPILVRNPEFLKYFMDKLANKKLKYDLKNETKAYELFVERFKNGGVNQ